MTAAAAGALGLAPGAVTLVAPVVNGVLLLRLPFADPERLVVIWETNVARGRFENVGPSAQVAWNSQSPHRIIGVVGDVRHEGLETPPRPTIYFTHAQSATSVMYLTVRTIGAPEAFAAQLSAECVVSIRQFRPRR